MNQQQEGVCLVFYYLLELVLRDVMRLRIALLLIMSPVFRSLL